MLAVAVLDNTTEMLLVKTAALVVQVAVAAAVVALTHKAEVLALTL
jgi:hypothetical protein